MKFDLMYEYHHIDVYKLNCVSIILLCHILKLRSSYFVLIFGEGLFLRVDTLLLK